LINRVLGIDEAVRCYHMIKFRVTHHGHPMVLVAQHVSEYTLGESDIEKEFVSDQNKTFVLHDSEGFAPGEIVAFNTVESFILQRCEKEQSKEHLHAIW